MDTAVLRSRIIGWRRELHRIPEPAFKEVDTASYISARLAETGLDVESGIAGTGVVGTLDTGMPGPVVMLRADMDALPIEEATGLPFSSERPGFMHACGHDGHMAMLLGAAAWLASVRKSLTGKVRFLFQPAEEGPGGAEPMIQAGVMNNPRVDYVFGCHIWPSLSCGKIGILPGALMASMSGFDVSVHGKGGHAGMPHLAVDALDTAVLVINALQRIISRQSNPLNSTVLSIGKMHSGTAFNVIPDTAEFSGTLRTFDEKLWQEWPRRLEKIISGTCSSMGAEYTLNYIQGYPVLVNNPAAADIVKQVASSVLGKENIVAAEPTMGSDDFAFFLREAPGCYFFLGSGEASSVGLHHPELTFNEDILFTGAEVFARTVMEISGRAS